MSTIRKKAETAGKGEATRSARLGDFVKLLDQIRTLHEELLVLIGQKIEAMKSADLAAMRACQESEQGLTQRLNEREGLRRQLMDAIGSDLGLPPRAGRSLGISQLAPKLGERERAPVVSAVGRLKDTIVRVAQANRVAGAISRELVNHLRWVFAAVRPPDEKPAGYSGDGVPLSSSGARLFETVG